MEFGKVSPGELDSINFQLKEEPTTNQLIFGNKRASSTKFFIGCSKWGREEWVGKIYPPGTRERNFLQHYIEHFNSIELNATHYKIIGEKGILRWAEKAKGLDFRFCPKMYQGITHKGKLNDKKFYTNEFLRGIAAFQENLGPIFIQLSEKFSPKRKDELFAYLRLLPQGYCFFVELRHHTWFDNKEVFDELIDFLSSINMGFVITDTADRRDCVHMQLTIPKALIRFAGNDLHPTDFQRIDEWINRFKLWMDLGLEELYFFVHMQNETFTPDLVSYLVDKVNKHLKLGLLKPKFLSV